MNGHVEWEPNEKIGNLSLGFVAGLIVGLLTMTIINLLVQHKQ